MAQGCDLPALNAYPRSTRVSPSSSNSWAGTVSTSATPSRDRHANLNAASPTTRRSRVMPSSGRAGGRNEHYAPPGLYAAGGEAMRAEYSPSRPPGCVQIDDHGGGDPADPTKDGEHQAARPAQEPSTCSRIAAGLRRDSIATTSDTAQHGPRMTDISLARRSRDVRSMGAYSFEVANPRHQHEWRRGRSDLQTTGLIGPARHATNYVEHQS